MTEAFYYITVDRFNKRQQRLRRLTAQEAVIHLGELKLDPNVSWLRVERIEEVYNYFPADMNLNLIK